MSDSLFVPFPEGGAWLNLNDRMHHQPKRKHVKRWREAAEAAAEDHGRAHPYTVDILAEIHKAPGLTVLWIKVVGHPISMAVVHHAPIYVHPQGA